MTVKLSADKDIKTLESALLEAQELARFEMHPEGFGYFE